MVTHKAHLETTAIPKVGGKTEGATLVPTLTIISHPQMDRAGDRVFLFQLAHGGQIALSRTTPDFTPPLRALGRPLDDLFMSREPCYLKARSGGISLELGQSRMVMSVERERVVGDRDFSMAQIEQGVVLTIANRIALLLHLARPVSMAKITDHGLVGFSDALQFVRKEIDRVADLPIPVLLRGLSGTGKELVARAIHKAGPPSRPFVSINMGAIPPSLAASALFGALKGSFTGADRNQIGYFKAAQGGTLFLDEVGEAPPEVQVLLLRVLETGEMMPIGAQTTQRVDVRLIAATDADLGAMIKADSFKAPLFHRLAGYQISLPALSERWDDFGRLFLHFAAQELRQIGYSKLLSPADPRADPWLPADLTARLLQYPWPGNVRQLRNVVRQLVIGCRGEQRLYLTPHVSELLNDPDFLPTKDVLKSNSEKASMPRMPLPSQSKSLMEALRINHWEIKATAKQLGISRSTLYEWMDRTPGIRSASQLSRAEILKCMSENHGQVDVAAEVLQVSSRAFRRRISELGIK